MKLNARYSFCITGIDTDVGKTVATGIIAKDAMRQGFRTITQKIIQTGCTGISEDIVVHRKIMGSELLEVDRCGLTCPYVFSTPCSPHLAAKRDGHDIDITVIDRATMELSRQYDVLLIEGAGGLSVPITEDYTFADYLEERKIPTILVTTPRLGSINHTLNFLEIAGYRNIPIAAVIYNVYGEFSREIRKDSRELFQYYLRKYGSTAPVIDLLYTDCHQITAENTPDIFRQIIAPKSNRQ